MMRLTLLFFGFLFSVLAFSADMYITGDTPVPLRSLPCANCTIVHTGLSTGSKLYVIEYQGEWSRVRTNTGLEGWLPGKYLVEQPPETQGNTGLRNEAAREIISPAQSGDSAPNPKTPAQRHSELEKAYTDSVERLKALELELSTLKKISGNALALQEQNEELIKRNRILQSEIDVLTASRDQLQSDNTQTWFIYGAVAVFLGALLVAIIPRLRTKRRYSEWA